jgi:hypothetical protein
VPPTAVPTYTPYPTQTPWIIIATQIPTPVPTESENTPPGTILEVGETWKQNGVYLTVEKIDLDERGIVLPHFVVENRTGQTISFIFEPANVDVVDNNGNIFEQNSITCPQTYHIQDRERLQTIFACWGGSIPSHTGDFFDPTVSHLLVVVSEFGRIDEARWKIDVAH